MKQTSFKSRFLILLLGFLTLSVTQVWGDVNSTYTFSTKAWKSSVSTGGVASTWTGSKDGNQFNSTASPLGVQICTGQSGVTITSSASFSGVKEVIVTYNSSSKGVGNIGVKIGDNTALTSQNISKSQTGKSLSFSPSSAQSGQIVVTFNCSTNSYGISSVTVVTGASKTTVSVAVADGQSSMGSVVLYDTQTEEVSGGTGEFNEDDVISVYAEAISGYNFIGWTLNSGTDATWNGTSTASDYWAELKVGSKEVVATANFEEAGCTGTDLSNPSNLTASNLGQTTATLSWTGVDHASSYTLKLGSQTISGLTETSYNATSLTEDQEYTWSVQAIGDGTTYCNSDEVSGTAFTPTDPSKKKLNFAFTSQISGWPSSSSAGNYTYTLNNVAYTFALTSNVYINTYQDASYLMLKSTAALGLPAIQGYKLTKVVASNSSGCSTSTSISIRTGNTSSDALVTGGEAQTWSTKSSSYTYTLSNTAANTMYYVYAASANSQIINLALTYEQVSLPKVAVTLASNPAAAATIKAYDNQLEEVTNLTQIEQGTELTLEATYNSDNYKFINWTLSDDNGGASLDNATSSTPTLTVGSKAVTVTANFDTYYAVAVSQPTGATLSAKIGDAAVTKALAGNEITVSYQLTDNYVFNGWVITNTSTSADVTSSVLNGTTLTMPAYAITISANVTEKTGEDLPKPTGLGTVDESIKSYGATLKWNEVANASKYEVFIMDDDQYEQTYSNVATDQYSGFAITGLKAKTTYYWTVKAIGDGEDYYTSPVSETADFTTIEKTPTKIEISGTFKKTYTTGDVFNKTGVVVTATYDDGSKANVTSDAVFPTTGLTKGTTQIEVSYTFNGTKVTTNITDLSVVDAITITWKANGSTYGDATIVTNGKVGSLPAVNPTSACDTRYPYFAGWILGETLGDEPQFITAETPITESVIASAVFAKTRTANGFTKLENANFKSGVDYAIGAYYNNNTYYIAASNETAEGITSGLSWAVSTTTATDAMLFQLANEDNSMKSAVTASGNYLVASTTNKKFIMSSSKSTFYLTDAGKLQQTSTGSSYLYHNYNNGSGGFRWYTTTQSTQDAYFYEASYTYSNFVLTCPETYTASVVSEITGGTVGIKLEGGAEYVSEIADQEAGTKILLHQTTTDGYTFNNFLVNSSQELVKGNSQDGYYFNMPAKNATVSASYTKIPVTDVTINGESSVSLGKTITLTLDITPTTARPTIEWSSENTGVATVNQEGVVTPVATGTTNIVATVDGTGYNKEIQVIAGVTFQGLSISGTPKTDYTLNEAFVKPTVMANYTYTVGGGAAPSVDVTALATFEGFDNQNAGNQTITVKYTDGTEKSTTYNVTVSPWNLYLVTRKLTGNNVETAVNETVSVTTLASAVDLTQHYATLCDGYAQVGYIKSSDKVSGQTAPAGLLTNYTPETNGESLYGVFTKTDYQGVDFVNEAFNFTSSSSTMISVNDYTWMSARTLAYPDAGCLKLGSSGSAGSVTTNAFTLNHNFIVEFDVKKYNTNDVTEMQVTVNGTSKKPSVTYTTANFVHASLSFDAIASGTYSIVVGTTTNGKRAYIKNLHIYTASEMGYTSVYDCRAEVAVTYNLNDGGKSEATTSCEGTTVLEGQEYTICGTNPSWTGHTFDGWKVNGEGDLKAKSSVITINAATELVAQWTEVVADGVELDQDSKNIDNGKSFDVTATITNADAYNKTINWSWTSTDGGAVSVAETSQSGVATSVTATHAGTVTLKATTATGEKTDEMTITINEAIALATLEFTSNHRNFTIGDTFVPETVTAVYSDDTKKVIADQSQVEWDEVTMTTAGEVTVKATYTENEIARSNTYTITLAPWKLNVYQAPEKLLQQVDVNSVGATVTVLASPAIDGNTFAGYATEKGSIEVEIEVSDNMQYTPAANNESLYAVYMNGKYVLVTDVAQLKEGYYVVIAGKEYNSAAGSQNSSSYRNKADITKSNDKQTIISLGDAWEFKLGKSGSYYTLFDEENKGYVYSQASNASAKIQETLTDEGKWNITISEGTLSMQNVSHNTYYMRYNYSSPRFGVYAGTQQPIALYISPIKLQVSANNLIIVDQDADLNEDDLAGQPNVVVRNGAKLTLSGDNITINDLTIESTMAGGNSGQIVGITDNNFAIAGDAYIDITLADNANAEKWHAFTVPFAVDMMNGIFNASNNAKLTNEQDYAIMVYQGAVRANGEYGWIKVPKTGTTILQPGTFYIMTVTGKVKTFRFKKYGEYSKPSNEISVTKYTGSGADTDAGWNGIGNTQLAYSSVDAAVQVLDPTSYTFVAKTASSTNFTVGTPFFYQASATGLVELNAAIEDKPAYVAARRMGVTEVKDVDITLANSDYTDHLYISSTDEATNEYQIGHDLTKMTMTSTPTVPQIFAEAYGTKLCMIDAPMVNDEATYVLSLYAPKAGEYTMAAAQVEGYEIYLTQKGEVIWNLSMGAYPVELNKGDNAGYGLVIKKKPNTTTDINSVRGTADGVQKFILDEKLVIIRDGKMYNAEGALIK